MRVFLFLYLPTRSTFSHFEPLITKSWIEFCFCEVFEWFILKIGCKRKCPIVDTDSFCYSKIFLHLHPFEWTRMHSGHKPSGIIGSNREESDIKSFWKSFSDFFHKWPISRISCEVSSPIPDFPCKSSPESFVPIGDPTSWEVLTRDECDFTFADFLSIPPVHIDDVLDPAIFEVLLITKSCIYRHMISSGKFPESYYIHMIVVIVGENHEVELRKVRKSYSWCRKSSWSCPLNRTRTVTPDRIGEEIDSLCLDEECGMSDIGNFHGFTFMSRLWFYRMNMPFFPERNSLIQDPFPEGEETIFSFFSEKFFFCFGKSKCFSRVPSDIVEFFSIKMIVYFSCISLTGYSSIHEKYNPWEKSSGR